MTMRGTFRLLTVTLGLGLGAATANAQDCNVYAFGDSLSDIGKKSKDSMFNLSNKVEPPSKPYFNGRYADGLVWVEYVKALACPDGNLTGYAAGGSFTDDRNLNVDIAPDAGGLSVQVEGAIADGVTFDDGDLVLIWAGANDYIFDTITAFLDPSGMTPFPNPYDVVANVVSAIQQLAAQGAKTFLVPNMPSLGNTPFALAVGGSGALSAGLNDLSKGHNQILSGTIAGLNMLGIKVIPVDVQATFNAILTNPGEFGYQNAEYPCLAQDPERNRTPTGVCPEQGNTYVGAGTVFWDLLHPTTSVHQLIAANAVGALNAASSSQVASAQ